MLGGLLAILGIVLCLLMASVVHHHMPPASVAAGEPMVMDDVDHVSLPPAVTTVTARAVGFAGLAAPAGPVRHLRHTIFQPPEGA